VAGPSPAGGPVVPGPLFEIGAPHITFGPPVATYIQYCILKMWPLFWILAPRPPLLLNPGDGPGSLSVHLAVKRKLFGIPFGNHCTRRK